MYIVNLTYLHCIQYTSYVKPQVNVTFDRELLGRVMICNVNVNITYLRIEISR